MIDLPRQQWSLLNRFRTEWGHCGACRRKWRLTDTDLCPCGETQTMSHVVEFCPWQNWMAAYLGYTLRMKTLFRGWPVTVDDTHTRRRRWSGNPCLSYSRCPDLFLRRVWRRLNVYKSLPFCSLFVPANYWCSELAVSIIFYTSSKHIVLSISGGLQYDTIVCVFNLQ